MPKRRFDYICLLLIGLLWLGMQGCSSDDEGTGEPPSDNVAPVVVEIDPSEEVGVGVNQAVTIEFSEPMDESTATGNVTLSLGAPLNLTWDNNSTELNVSHAAWPQATQISVTVDTGLKDVAGNSLPQTWSTNFFTESAAVVLLQSDPANDDDDVLTTVQPWLLFSHEMQLQSLINATTITEPSGGKVVPGWDIESLDENQYRIEFDDELSTSTDYNIAISTNAVATGGAGNLSQAVSIDFTTGLLGDNIPPHITSTAPTGSGVSPDQTSATITFSEPVRPQIIPTRIAGQLLPVMASAEPTWNSAGDQATIYFATQLPAGVRLFAVFGAGTFEDLSGNANTVTDSVSFTVAGTPDYFPVTEKWEWLYSEFGIEQEFPKQPYYREPYVRMENISGNDFEIAEYELSDYLQEYELSDRTLMRKTGSGVFYRGFYEEDLGANILFNPLITYLTLPLAVGTWDGTSTATVDQQTMTIDYEGETLGQETLIFSGFGQDMPTLVMENCWKSILNHEVSAGAQTTQTGADTLWFAAGLGIVQEFTKQTDFGESSTVVDWFRRYLLELHIND